MQRILVCPDIESGAPCVAGTRVRVAQVLSLLERGCSAESVRRSYFPHLTAADIRACVRYGQRWCGCEWLNRAGQPPRAPTYRPSFWFNFGMPLLLAAALLAVWAITARGGTLVP